MRVALLIMLIIAVAAGGCAISPPYKGHVRTATVPPTGFR